MYDATLTIFTVQILRAYADRSNYLYWIHLSSYGIILSAFLFIIPMLAISKSIAYWTVGLTHMRVFTH